MRSGFKAIYAVGSTALILASGAAVAQVSTGITGINFGTYGADTTCNIGTNCRIIASSAGFVQRQFVVDSKTYIQTVIDDKQGSGFNMEDFVQLQSQGSTPGISSLLTISGAADTTTGTGTFATDSLIKSGWANNNGPTLADITINLKAPSPTGTTGQDFDSNFNVKTTYDAASGKNTITDLAIDQTVGLGSASEKQEFKSVITLAGTDQATALKFLGASNQSAGAGVSWATGNVIQMTWVGQSVNLGTVAAPALTEFGAESLQNITATTATFGSNLSAAAPVNWTQFATAGSPFLAEFGAAPTF